MLHNPKVIKRTLSIHHQRLRIKQIFKPEKLEEKCRNSINYVRFESLSSERTLTNNDIRSDECFDLAIIGGGIVGMATAQELKSRMPSLSIAVLEKERELAAHQSGRNSGVIHGGIYYKPGSLRSKLCVEGLKMMYAYCDKHDIPYKKCGKLIVATDQVEVERLNELMKRGLENGVPDLKMIDQSGIKEIEPYCKGLKAVHSPHTGIVDYGLVTQKYGSEFTRMGGKIFLGFKVSQFSSAAEGSPKEDVATFPIRIFGSNKNQCIRAGFMLTCGGLHSDKLAEMTGDSPEPRIIPFRGEYLLLRTEKNYLINGNIYPVPDPRFPFLGVHFTPRMNGEIWLGPNALLAFRKEGYRKLDINFKELYESLSHRGFQKFFYKYLGLSLNELRKSIFIGGQIKDLQKFVPDIQPSDVISGPSGIRAQAMDVDGNLIEDFVFSGEGRILHCRNAPSPGATSSLAIAKILADKVMSRLQCL